MHMIVCLRGGVHALISLIISIVTCSLFLNIDLRVSSGVRECGRTYVHEYTGTCMHMFVCLRGGVRGDERVLSVYLRGCVSAYVCVCAYV